MCLCVCVCVLLNVTSIVQNVYGLFSVFSTLKLYIYIYIYIYIGYVYNKCTYGKTLTMKLDIGPGGETGGEETAGET